MRRAIVSGIVTGERAGQLLATFFFCPTKHSQRSLRKLTLSQFPTRLLSGEFLLTICRMFKFFLLACFAGI